VGTRSDFVGRDAVEVVEEVVDDDEGPGADAEGCEEELCRREGDVSLECLWWPRGIG